MKAILVVVIAFSLSGCLGPSMNKYYDGVEKCGGSEKAKPVYSKLGFVDHVECTNE